MSSSNTDGKILIVDDIPDNVYLIRHFLEKQGYEVLQADSGPKALKMIEDGVPDLILLDIFMPVMDGFEVCRELKRNSKTNSVPVIFISALNETLDKVKAFEVGGVDFVTKPIQKEEVLVRVQTHLRLHALQEETKKNYKKLEQHNTTLQATNRKLESLNQTKQQLLAKISEVYNTHIGSLTENLDCLDEKLTREEPKTWMQIKSDLLNIEDSLKPITQLYDFENAFRSKRVLLAESNKRHEILAKMALGGSGVELTIVTSLEEGKELLDQNQFDILFVNRKLCELAHDAQKQSPPPRVVLMTSKEMEVYLPLLQKHPYLTNIISRHWEDRLFSIKDITTTVGKLSSGNIFGLEKYMNWGVEVQTFPITASNQRHSILESMQEYLDSLGVRKPHQNKITMIAEELLMNAIYDAPSEGDSPKYNHLPRTSSIELLPSEQGKFRFACDGVLLAISAEDPFGTLDRKTILSYLDRCYRGEYNLEERKGGAGMGLFQIMHTSNLFVINVNEHVKTEVIAILNIDPNASKSTKASSFHFFSD